MSQELIGIGAAPNDGTGDTLRAAFTKVNDNFTELYGAGGISLANPTALAGLSAVNGSAGTAMRSDAAPAIDQSITPNWTNVHNFGNGLNVAGGRAFKYNNVNVLLGDTTARNYFFGPSGNFTATGQFNTAVGDSLLQNLTSGEGNVAFGFATMFANTSGNFNIAIGFEALNVNTSGGNNIAIGENVMSACLTGVGNIAIGQSALNSLTANDGLSGPHIAIGNLAMQNYTDHGATGLRNTAIGHSSLQALRTGGYNTGCGFESNLFAGRNDGSQTCNDNTAFGALALCYNTDGSDNTAVGMECMFGNGRADSPGFGSNNMSQCTAVGAKALLAVGNGAGIVAVGYQAGADITDGGDKNTIIGTNTGRGITTGSKNTILGAGVTGLSATLANKVIISDGDGNVVLDTRPYTVSGLPAASAALKGARAFVTDASSPTFLGTLTGGSTTVCPVFCNGTTWVAG